MAPTTDSPHSALRPKGRPLDPARDAAILDAALAGLADVGYERLSMEEIAARARVGKGALYRRWAHKGALVVDAMLRWREQVAPLSVPDTGSLLDDLEALVAGIPDLGVAMERQIAVLVGLLGAATRDAALRHALAESGFGRPRRMILEVFERAAARGEIAPDVDLGTVADLVMGVNFVHMVLRGEPPTRARVRHVLLDVVYPLVTRTPLDVSPVVRVSDAQAASPTGPPQPGNARVEQRD